MFDNIFRCLARRPTFDDAVAHYERVILQRNYQPKTLQQRASEIRHLRPVFAGRRLDRIRPFEISGVINALVKQDKATTGKHVLLLMRDVCNEAILMGWLDTNPALHVKPPRARIKRQRLTLEQWKSIREAGEKVLPAWFAPMMTLALVSGQRRSDLVRMRWDHVRDGRIYIEQYKTGTRIALPLELRLDVIGVTLGDAIEACRACCDQGEYLLRRT